MTDSLLNKSLTQVRSRLVKVGVAAGTGWALAGMLIVLMLFAWVDLALDLPPAVRAICGWSSLIFGLALLLRSLFLVTRHASTAFLARRIDQITRSGGQVLTGADLANQFGSATATIAPGISQSLARMAIERAAQIADQAIQWEVVPAKPVGVAYTALGGVLFALGITSIFSPRLVAAQWHRFTDPYGDHPPYSTIEIDVQPGETKVIFGASLDVRASFKGAGAEQIDHVELRFAPANSAAEESIPMFPQSGGSWRANIADVTAAGQYYVKSTTVRSKRFKYDIITVPEFREVHFRITPPAYTHRPPYEGPMPQGGISGLRGTQVELRVRSNRPLSGGSIAFNAEGAPTTQPGKDAAAPVSLTPVTTNSSEAVGRFVIDRAGKLNVTIVDVEGQPSREPFVAPVALLTDQRPFVRILEPKPESFATPDVTLGVQIVAEDDFGISRLQLFRGLNDSRVLSTDVIVPANQPTRLPTEVPLKLGDYSLMPGDVVKLYARVEDNDPAGAKGAETPVVMVHIISKEDFDRMILAREGLEVLEAKYAQAMRRLEALDDQIAKAQEQLKKSPPDSPLAEAARKQIEDLARQMDRESQAVSDSAKQDLPFDIDKNFSQKLDEVAKTIKDAADAARQGAAVPGGSSGDADKKLQEARDKLGVERKEYKKDVAEPMEKLAKVYPLIEDEAKFVDLWRQQRDLADRLKSAPESGADNPAAKARMRDLEAEQRELRDALNIVISDIEEHAAALPADPDPLPPGAPSMDKLRQTATDFALAARSSGAAEEMATAEQDIHDFDGPAGAIKARQAANDLEALIARCKNMEGDGEACLKFQPSLAESLGNSVEQLLNAEGLGMGSKPGKGTGAGGGFSQRRSSLRNVGLYGNRPTGKPGGGQGGRRVAGAGGSPTNSAKENTNPDSLDVTHKQQAAGASDAAVPPQYKQKVGDYFQRVADELGEK